MKIGPVTTCGPSLSKSRGVRSYSAATAMTSSSTSFSSTPGPEVLDGVAALVFEDAFVRDGVDGDRLAGAHLHDRGGVHRRYVTPHDLVGHRLQVVVAGDLALARLQDLEVRRRAGGPDSAPARTGAEGGGDACAGAQRGDGTNEVTTTDSLADRFGGRACKHFIHRPQATDVLLHPCCRGVYDVYGSPVGVRGWPAAMTVPPVGLEPTLDGF